MPDSDVGFVRDIARGFKQSLTLRAAVELDVFTHVAAGAETPESVAERAGTDPRATALLMNALVSLDLLAKRDGTFRNTAVASNCLVADAPADQSDYVEYTTSTVPYFLELADNVERGHAPEGTFGDLLGGDEALTRKFFGAMHTNAVPGAEFLASELPRLEEVDRIYDVGGGTGAYATVLLREHETIGEAVVADLPYVIEHVTTEYVEGTGVEERVRTAELDYETDAFEGGNDLVLLNTLMHQHQPAFVAELFAKARRSLVDGGRVVASTFFTDETGTEPAHSAMFGVEILALLPDGHLYTLSEGKQLLRDAGFEVTSVLESPGAVDFLIAET
jgi:SAM-dependent methyltransferase